MIKIRKGSERGRTRIDWLDSRHTFSFGDYYEPSQMGFRQLRVINEDRVKPGTGFATHSHQDMEIITYVLEGSLQHRDSLGNGSIIQPGDIQRMSAGTGIRHSEFNPSESESVHFLQIWITPSVQGLPPGYEQRSFDLSAGAEKPLLLVGPEQSGGGVLIHQDARISLATPSRGKSVGFEVGAGRQAWLQIARGSIHLNGHLVEAGDGVATDERSLEIATPDSAEVLIFDLA
jgi:redox-sensitive bicupin YhaK (pirin superfamily)